MAERHKMKTGHKHRRIDALIPDEPIARWLWMVAGLTYTMIVVGGFVRLSRAGLSIVDWDPVTGIIPPVGDGAWQEEFSKYQTTPEYLLVNGAMTLGEFQRIFMIEWAHRLIARIAGLLVVIPLAWFMIRGTITVRESIRYWAVAALFGVQAVLGWVMVSSGLRDRPIVSNTRLAVHLLVALALVGIVMWMALDTSRRPPTDTGNPMRPSTWWLSVALVGVTVAQIAVGAVVAGLRAGTVSNTWPLMAGRWIPPGLLTDHDPWMRNFIEPVGSHWLHRWLAFIVVGVAIALLITIRRDPGTTPVARTVSGWVVGVVALQVGLGVSVVVLLVPKWLALAHQAIGVAVFSLAVIMAYEVRLTRSFLPATRAVHRSRRQEPRLGRSDTT